MLSTFAEIVQSSPVIFDFLGTRHGNNHTDAFKQQCFKLALLIHQAYGQPYDKAVQYLKDPEISCQHMGIIGHLCF